MGNVLIDIWCIETKRSSQFEVFIGLREHAA